MSKDILLQRRNFLKHAALAGAAVGSSFLANSAVALEPRKAISQPNQYPFLGSHQQGIATPAQHHIYFMVLDLHTGDVQKIKAMFQTWTTYANNLTQGKNVKPYATNSYVPPVDTGESDSLNPYHLTLTFGVSPSFLDKLKIAHLKPNDLIDLPHFPRDQLREEYTGGDICIQTCADDPQVAFHAVRNLVRVARSNVTMRWSQSGFNSFEGNETPRNLFGFKDGTGNPQGEALDRAVWYQGDNWLKDGTFIAVRRV